MMAPLLRALAVFALIAPWVLIAGSGRAAAVEREAGDKRVALVIGNGDYSRGDLPNATNDAALIAAALARFEFDVHEAVNVTTAGFDDTLDQMAAVAAEADVLVVYYAGHAFQYGGKNWLMMTDAQNVDAESTFEGSVPVSRLLESLSALNPEVLVLLLDSCRDNPFVSARLDIAKGLSHVEAGTGQVMIGYATTEGEVAYDGTGSNSPYAIAISGVLERSGTVSLASLFRDVRRTVREATNGLQIPWVSSSVEDDVVISVPPRLAKAETEEILSPTLEQVLAYFARDGIPEPVSLVRAGDPDASGDGQRLTLDNADSESSAEGGEQDLLYASTADRTPARELRMWPGRLPDAQQGLRSVVTDCDTYAADPDDPARVASGARLGLVPIRPAALACISALSVDPENPRLQYQLARVLEGARLYDWAVHFYEQAVAAGYSAAMVQLGYLHREGRGMKQDYDAAFALTRQAALAGNPRARTNLGTMFKNGWGVPQSFDEAVLWYRLAGSMGWPNALDSLANMYANGEGVEQSSEAAVKLYRIAAAAGQTNAMNNLGRAYLQGEGVEKDEEEGLRWLRQGVEAGNRFAARSLAIHLLEDDPAEAERLLLFSADAGNPSARIDLARLYWKRNGDGDRAKGYFQAALADELKVRRGDELRAEYASKLSAAEREKVDASVADWLRLYGN